MSLKFRFALLFTIVVAFIQATTFFAIYYFYADHRKIDFQTKLRSEALLAFDVFSKDQRLEKDLNDLLVTGFNNKFINGRSVVVYSLNEDVISKTPINSPVDIPPIDFFRIKKYNEHYFEIKNREYLGIYLKDNKQVIVVSAIDVEGLPKLLKLRIILMLVFLVSILLTAFGSYFFVTSALKPLKILIDQIDQTNENNLWKKVNEGNGKDEIAKIAINYNQMIDRLKKAFEMQQIFVQHASHELRTPLTVMFSTTESALNKNLKSEEYVETLLSLKEEQNNLIELTNSLLLLYQFDKYKSYSNWHLLRMDELIYDAISYSKKIYPGIYIDFEFVNEPEEDDLYFKGIESLLKAAISNLIKNAFLYSEDKKLKISILAQSDSLEIYFDNNGAHLTQHEIETLKKPFSRSEDIGLIKGIGLGLSIVEKIIELHHGKFLYKALPDSVNRFTIILKYPKLF